MDFPVCPACGQSVIDDDPEDCPFCGASMKSKPAAAPPSGKPTASAPGKTSTPSSAAPPAKGASNSGPASRPGGPRPIGKGAINDEIPITADDSLLESATAAVAVRTKSRTHEVVCPMCETVGYVPVKAAGGPVKCANPKCLVPLFQSPPIPVEKPAEANVPVATKNKNRTLILGLVTALVVSGLGGGAYYLASRPAVKGPTGPKELTPEELAEIKRIQGDSTPVATNQNTTTKVVPQPNEVKVDWLAKSLKLIDDASLLSGDLNRKKALCRMIGIEAFAMAGDLKGARLQLEQFNRVGAQTQFLRVNGLTEIAWIERSKPDGNTKATLDSALADAGKLPKTGRGRLQTVVRLASVLMADNRMDDALKLMQSHSEAEKSVQQLAGQLLIAATDHEYNLAETLHTRNQSAWNAPLEAAVICDLVRHGRPDVAMGYIKSLSDPKLATDCRAAFAMSYRQQSREKSPVESVITLADELEPPAHAAQMLARVAVSELRRGRKADGQKLLEAAVNRAAAIKPGNEFVLPDTAGIVKLGQFLEGVTPSMVATHCDFVRAYGILKNVEAAKEALNTAILWGISAGPAVNKVEQIQSEVQRLGPAGTQQMLKSSLKLKADVDVKKAWTNYRENLSRSLLAAKLRFSLLEEALETAAMSGLSIEAFEIAGQQQSRTGENLLTPSFASQLRDIWSDASGRLPENYGPSFWTNAGLESAPKASDFTVVIEMANSGKGEAAAKLIEKYAAGSIERERLALRAATQLAATGKFENAIAMLGRMTDFDLREECMTWMGAELAKQGQAALVVQTAEKLPQATEKVSLGRGVVWGLVK